MNKADIDFSNRIDHCIKRSTILGLETYKTTTPECGSNTYGIRIITTYATKEYEFNDDIDLRDDCYENLLSLFEANEKDSEFDQKNLDSEYINLSHTTGRALVVRIS